MSGIRDISKRAMKGNFMLIECILDMVVPNKFEPLKRKAEIEDTEKGSDDEDSAFEPAFLQIHPAKKTSSRKPSSPSPSSTFAWPALHSTHSQSPHHLDTTPKPSPNPPPPNLPPCSARMPCPVDTTPLPCPNPRDALQAQELRTKA